MSEIIDLPFSNAEVAKRLEIGESTLRKWCKALEEQKYSWEKAEQDKRLIYENDVKVLQYYKELVTNRNMSLKNAAVVITSRFTKENGIVLLDGTELEQGNTKVFSYEADVERERNENELRVNYDELANVLRVQQEQMFIQLKEQLKHELIQDLKEEITTIQQDNNQELFNKIESALGNQESAIKSNLEKRDKYLMESLKESMEAKKQIAATEEQSNKKKWYQIWK